MRAPHQLPQSPQRHHADAAMAVASRAVPSHGNSSAAAAPATSAYAQSAAGVADAPARRVMAEPPAGRSLWSSDQLFGDRHEIEIAHGASVYRLRVTSLGKLILTK